MIPQTLKFQKEHTGRWYAVIPSWTGSKADLEMVAGADTLLDKLAQGGKEVEFEISEQPFEGANKLTLTEGLTDSVGGGMYLLKEYQGQVINHKLWLCSVTNWLFEKLPPVVYFK